MVVKHLTGMEYSLSELVRHLGQVDNRNEYVLYLNFVRPEYAVRFESRVRPLLSDRVQARICRIPSRLMQSAGKWMRWPIERTLGPCSVVHDPAHEMFPQRHGARVATIHDLMPLTHPQEYPAEYVALFGRVVPDVARRADALIAVSQYTKNVLVDLLEIPPERIVVVHHGVDESFRPAPRSAVEALRTRLALVRPYILFVGTAEPRKNLLRLVDAFAQIRRQGHEDVDLVLAGKSAWGSPRLRQRIAAHELAANIHLPGHVAGVDLPTLYCGAAAFVLPSLAEGFGMPLLEAMACGVPVIASKATALPEVYGDAALGFDPTSTEALADAISRVLADEALRADLIGRGFRRAARFRWQETARRTLAVFEAVA